MIAIVEKKTFKDFSLKLKDFLDDKINIYNYIRAKDLDKVFIANYSYNEYKQNIKRSSLASLRCMYKNNITITRKYYYVERGFDLEMDCIGRFKNSFIANDLNFLIDNFIIKVDLIQIDENEKIVRLIECKNSNSIKNIIIQNFHTILLSLIFVEKLNKEYDLSFKYVIYYSNKTKEFDSVYSFINYSYIFMKNEYTNVLEHVRKNACSEISFDIFSAFIKDIYISNYKHENIYLKYKNELNDRVKKYLSDIYKSSVVLLRETYDDELCYKCIDTDSLDELKKLHFNCYAKINNKYYIKYADRNEVCEAFVDKFIKNIVLL